MNRVTATIMSSTFLSVANAMSWAGFFILLAVVCLLILVWMYIYLPETKGRPLEEMSQYFAEITGDRSIMEAEALLYRQDEPSVESSRPHPVIDARPKSVPKKKPVMEKPPPGEVSR